LADRPWKEYDAELPELLKKAKADNSIGGIDGLFSLVAVSLLIECDMIGAEDIMFDRITSDPKQMNGQPCIRGMRLTVRRVIELLATYSDRIELRTEFPELEDEDIQQALLFAAANLDDRIIPLNGNHETAA
jgi:uncharacterized protein (DUF433 family)